MESRERDRASGTRGPVDADERRPLMRRWDPRRRAATASVAIMALLGAACGEDPGRVTTAGESAPAPATAVATTTTVVPASEPSPTRGTPRPPLDRPPTGGIEAVGAPAPGYLQVRGWARDPDTGPVAVTLDVDDTPAAEVTADERRLDASGEFSDDGFSVDLAADVGVHVVCATAPAEGGEVRLGCVDAEVSDVASSVDRREIRLTAVRPAAEGAIEVRGVLVGPGRRATSTIAVTTHEGAVAADALAAPGRVAVDDGTVRFTVDGLSPGTHLVCPVAAEAIEVVAPRPDVDVGVGTGCGSAVIGDPAVGTTGRPASSTVVAPRPGHPLRATERDGGVSVELGDGSVLWFFGDTAERGADGGLRYFVNNTAAWASADAPTTTRDAVEPDGTPVLFADPPEGICSASPYPNPAMWPEAAIAVPLADGRDRVVVFMGKVCLGTGFLDIDDVGLAVAEYLYDPEDPPVDRPVRGRVTQPDLAPTTARFGRAAVLAPDGYVYGQECGVFPDAWGPCRVARVRPESLTEPAAWRYWNGGPWIEASSWSPDRRDAAPTAMPAPVGEPYPVAAFDLEHDEDLGVYVMAYTPWPGFCGRVALRIAETPVGPWTEPVEVTLPDCREEIDGQGYYCYAGTLLSTRCAAETVGVGYFDMLVDGSHAEYRAVQLPFSVR
jgi:hypothetical protein